MFQSNFKSAFKVALPLLACGSLFSAPAMAQQNILSVGDSIVQGTAGQCSFRFPLSQMIENDASCNVNFVGSRRGPFRTPSAGTCNVSDFTNHFAESGRRADFFIPRIGEEVQNQQPDFVIMHVGSNDMNQGQTVETTIDDINNVMTTIFQEQPNVTILMGNIIPWDDSRTGEPGTTERIAALGPAVEELVASRRAQGDAVELVDVRTGFDTDSMTVDGVHPNNEGERFMADRFMASLSSLGLCSTFMLPEKTLANGDWYQIALPANPGSQNTVREIIGDDLPIEQMANGEPGGTWTMFEFVNGDGGATEDSYRRLGPEDRLVAGKGYWIRQATGSSVQIDMPPMSLPTALSADPACLSEAGCFAIPLSADANRIRWNMVGNPFAMDRAFGDVRISTSSGNCSAGCSPGESRSSNFTNDALFRFNAAANRYDRVVNAENMLFSWDAGWLGVLPGSQGRNPRMLFSSGN